jgi:hypothetical protein
MTQNAVTTTKVDTTLSVFSGQENFQNAMIMAEQLSKSDMIPATYKGKPENCIIALELSNRLKLSPFLVMQNMYIVQGRPAWSSSFIISCINGSGRFTGPLMFEMDEAKTKCRAYATDKLSNKKLVGPLITMEMAQAEGWLGKNGSKWKTMPELMLRYRAAAFFGRLYCPEIINGMLTAEEAQDIRPLTNENDAIDVFAEPVAEITEPKAKEMEISAEMEAMANEYFEANEQ